MGLPLRILLGLGLPSVLVAVALTLATVAFDGPPPPWNVLLAVPLGLAVLMSGIGYAGFLAERGLAAVAPFAVLAGVVVVIAAFIGVNQRALHEHGHDVACRLTSIDQRPNAQSQTYIQYGVDCDGGAPTLIASDVVPTEEAKVGLRVVLRYDADGGALTALARDSTDGHVALTVAAAAAGVLLLIGLITAVVK